MQYTSHYVSFLGDILLAADDIGLVVCGLSIRNITLVI